MAGLHRRTQTGQKSGHPWIKEAVAARKQAKNKDAAFYAGQMATARFFINTLLPSVYGKMDAIIEGDSCVEDILDVSFGSK